MWLFMQGMTTQRKKGVRVNDNATSAVAAAANGNDWSNGVTHDQLAVRNGSNGVWWTAIAGTVYDFSDFYDSHPGGDIIRTAGGR
jgi:cytochrome b involved in lipid metabolism